jgi:hypothetical protein
LLSGRADPGSAGWQRDVSTSLTGVGDVRLAAGDWAGALLAYEGSLAIRRELAAPLIRRGFLRLGLLVAYPLPYRTKSPVVSVIDFERLRESERLVLLFIQQAPNVHLAAAAEKLAQLLAGDEVFVAKLRSASPR